MGILLWSYRNQEGNERTLWMSTSTCQQIIKLSEIDKFLEMHKLSKLIQENLENMNSSINKRD